MPLPSGCKSTFSLAITVPFASMVLLTFCNEATITSTITGPSFWGLDGVDFVLQDVTERDTKTIPAKKEKGEIFKDMHMAA